ncbi:hypothetical protein DFP72DRAFT_933030 [Ephemerocybe angulata]|uniref:Uncharacterized protein n=1 Tax=Ephemerocybe angulata TaxID=980116 RepID=A0A8H6LUT5_9AGAR|nr:hypothetical protein DFP72DRAFT_933030 [Tulosesus angulatus]
MILTFVPRCSRRPSQCRAFRGSPRKGTLAAWLPYRRRRRRRGASALLVGLTESARAIPGILGGSSSWILRRWGASIRRHKLLASIPRVKARRHQNTRLPLCTPTFRCAPSILVQAFRAAVVVVAGCRHSGLPRRHSCRPSARRVCRRRFSGPLMPDPRFPSRTLPPHGAVAADAGRQMCMGGRSALSTLIPAA